VTVVVHDEAKPANSSPPYSWLRPVLLVVLGLVLAVVVILVEACRTAPVRAAVRTFTALLVAANRQDLAAARTLCTARYLQTQSLRPAPEGGLVGLPRNVPHMNYRAWKEGPYVRLCPSKARGPVYQFVREGDEWRFDGPVGLLLPDGQVVPMTKLEDQEGNAP
jgi:hypothetical protein